MNLEATLQDGRSLAEVADAHPVLLLFLRHFGCIFCREALVDLHRLRPSLDTRRVEVVMVHQGTDAEAVALFQEIGVAGFARIADPDRRLYRAFELRRASLREGVGLRVWIRALEPMRAGLRQGRVAGDVWQMPGCFVVRGSRILAAFPYDVASDRPDYLEFVAAALASDLTQLATLRPDGSLRPLAAAALPGRGSSASFPASDSATALPAPRSDAPAGRPMLLFVGGNGSSPERFVRLFPFLRERHDIGVLELAGQGNRAASPIPETLEGFARDLAARLELAVDARAGEPGPLYLYGHGIGGLVLAHALRFTSIRPAMLVLHSPVGVHLARRRFPRFMRLPGVTRTARGLLSGAFTGPRLARRFLMPGSQAGLAERKAFARGYRQARSFDALFRAVDPIDALDGLESLHTPTVLLWGARDRVLAASQLPAWAEVLKGAPVLAHVEPDWGHYPYLDDPEGFASVLQTLLEGTTAPTPATPTETATSAISWPPSRWSTPASFRRAVTWLPRTKAGRLLALWRAGFPVPDGLMVPASADEYRVAQALDRFGGEGPFSVRSSASLEDQAETTGAGLFRTELEVTRGGLLEAIRRVRASGPGGQCDALIMPMVPRTAGGVAWVRAIGADLEIAAGGAEAVVEGREGLRRARLSELGSPWHDIPDRLPGRLTTTALEEGLWPLLRRLLAHFDVPGLDVEWCYHPDAGFTILQARPLVPGLDPRRMLSLANIQEIVPPIPSRLLLDAADAVSRRAPRYYLRLDPRLSDLREPFTQVVEGRYFLNVDLYAAMLDRWGVPRAVVSRQVGGTMPAAPFRPWRLLSSVPAFLRLAMDQAHLSRGSARILDELERTLPPPGDAGRLADWFAQAYLGVVSGNFRISGALAASIPLFRGGPPPVTAVRQEALARLGADHPDFLDRWGHRGDYESDPAWPRGDHPAIRLEPRPRLPDPLTEAPALIRRLPWLGPRWLLAHREWFRDSAMRLWAAFRSRMRVTAQAAVEAGHLEVAELIWSLGLEALHLPPDRWRALLGELRRPSPELPPHLFWSDSLEAVGQAPIEAVALTAGRVEGVAIVARTPHQARAALKRVTGAAILVAPAVGPGWDDVFTRVSGVVTELGGRLSHAAVLLQEQGIPAAFNVRGITGGVKTGSRVRLEVPPGRLILLDSQDKAG